MRPRRGARKIGQMDGAVVLRIPRDWTDRPIPAALIVSPGNAQTRDVWLYAAPTGTGLFQERRWTDMCPLFLRAEQKHARVHRAPFHRTALLAAAARGFR